MSITHVFASASFVFQCALVMISKAALGLPENSVPKYLALCVKLHM